MVTRSLESVTVMRRPSICFHPGVQAVNEWQLDRKTDPDRPDSGASRPLAKSQHQLFGVYHKSINQGGALLIFDMSISILILKRTEDISYFYIGSILLAPFTNLWPFQTLDFFDIATSF